MSQAALGLPPRIREFHERDKGFTAVGRMAFVSMCQGANGGVGLMFIVVGFQSLGAFTRVKYQGRGTDGVEDRDTLWIHVWLKDRDLGYIRL